MQAYKVDYKIKWEPLDSVTPYARNPRKPADAVAKVSASIKEYGWRQPIVVDEENVIIAGHTRLMAAKRLGLDEVPVHVATGMTPQQVKAYRLADNRVAAEAEWDEDLLALELSELSDSDFDLSLTGFDDDELSEYIGLAVVSEYQEHRKLSDEFMVPPFSVLNAREGWWQDRKRSWLALGIASELGRHASPGGSMMPRPQKEYDKLSRGLLINKPAAAILSQAALNEITGRSSNISGTSIFDPVLCELSYRWFCPPSGTVLDPFAGGSVRGIVAAKLGREYIGWELRGEQVQANQEQAVAICDDVVPVWRCGDSRDIGQEDAAVDYIFTWLPYADLEVYSDLEADLSTLDYVQFLEAYRAIIAAACTKLKDDRFACVVVGEIRDKKGIYRNFVGDTVAAFRDAGLKYYNEMILVTAVGSLPVRAGRAFKASRKVGKTHQNMLVFVKGNGKRAASEVGPVAFSDSDNAVSMQ